MRTHEFPKLKPNPIGQFLEREMVDRFAAKLPDGKPAYGIRRSQPSATPEAVSHA